MSISSLHKKVIYAFEFFPDVKFLHISYQSRFLNLRNIKLLSVGWCGVGGWGMGDRGRYCRGVKNLPLSITVISCGTETETVLRGFCLKRKICSWSCFFLCMDGCRWALNHCRLTGAWEHGGDSGEGHGPETTVHNRDEPFSLMPRPIHTRTLYLFWS